MSSLSVKTSKAGVPLSPLVPPTKFFLSPQGMGSSLCQKHGIKSFNSLMSAHGVMVRKTVHQGNASYRALLRSADIGNESQIMTFQASNFPTEQGTVSEI